MISFFGALQAQEEISLRVLTTHGALLKTAAVGVPCILEVTLHNSTTNKNPELTLPQSASILAERVSSTMRMSNNVTVHEKRYNYTVQFNEPGQYTLQATVDLLISNELNMHVAVHEESNNPKTQPGAFLEVIPQKTTAYVGEKILYYIRFHYHNDAIVLQAIEPLKILDAVITVPEGAYKSQNMLEWRGSLYAQKAGDSIIPALHAQYLQAKHNNNHNNFLFSFFAVQEEKHCYSPAIKMTIKPLPPYHEKVEAIGQFTSFTLAADHTTLHEGEAFECTVTLKGSGNITQLSAPSLTIPESCKVYESRSQLEGSEPNFTKTFTYIIHALKSGSCEIPAQTFTYFDPQSQAYNQLTTEPIILTIQKPILTNTVPAVSKPELVTVTYIPVNWFIFLLLLPILWCISRWCIRRWNNYYKAKRALKKARKLLARKAIKDAPALYILMKDLHIVFTDHEHENWQKFWDQLLAAAFCDTHTAVVDQLIGEAKNWIDLYEKKLYSLRIKKLLFVLTVSSASLMHATPELLSELRAEQLSASYTRYYEIEEEIAQIKNIPFNKKSLFFNAVVHSMPWLMWQILCIMLWWSLFFFGNLIVRQRYIILLSLGMGLLLVGAGTTRSYYELYTQRAIVSKATELRLGPSAAHAATKLLSYLDEVTILKERDSWYLIEHGTKRGWVDAQVIKKIPRI